MSHWNSSLCVCDTAVHCLGDSKYSLVDAHVQGLARQCVTEAKASHTPTFLPVAQGNSFTPFSTPGDTGLRCTCRGAPERHVCPLSYNHVRAGWIVQDVRWNCIRKTSKYAFSRETCMDVITEEYGRLCRYKTGDKYWSEVDDVPCKLKISIDSLKIKNK